MIQLVPMTPEELEAYLARAVATYAQEHVAAGNWEPETALQLAEQSYRKLLPQGAATPGQYLFSMQDTETAATVGMLWFAAEQGEGGPRAFVYDVLVDEPFRRRGYAAQAFRALEDRVRALGLGTISLHVFGHNHAARALYEKLGYQVVDLIMSKALGEGGHGSG